MLIELHLHTYASKDSLMRPADIVRLCRQKGIGCVAVTDHNTIRGALELRNLAPELTIVGEEIMTTQGELLAYFVEEEVPPGLSPAETIARLRAQGAVISIAHPFDSLRQGAWCPAEAAAVAPLVDAVEVFNARCLLAGDNAQALAFAQEHAKLGTVGSDAHSAGEVGNAVLCVACRPADGAALRAALTQGERLTRLASPTVHIASAFAKYSKRLARRLGGGHRA